MHLVKACFVQLNFSNQETKKQKYTDKTCLLDLCANVLLLLLKIFLNFLFPLMKTMDIELTFHIGKTQLLVFLLSWHSSTSLLSTGT